MHVFSLSLSLLPLLFSYPLLSCSRIPFPSPDHPGAVGSQLIAGPGFGFGQRAVSALCGMDAGHEPAHVRDEKPLHQAEREAGQASPHCSAIGSRPLSKHEPGAGGTCWIRPPIPPEAHPLPAAGRRLSAPQAASPPGKELPYLYRRGRAGLPCLSAISGLPAAYQFIRGQKTLSRRVLRQCERLIRNSPAS